MTLAEQKKFIEGFKENKVIIVCRGIAEEEIVNVAEALYEGGVRYMEVPFDQKDVASNVVTARKIKLVSDAMKGRMHVGAGTTCTMDQLKLAIDAGAEIIISATCYTVWICCLYRLTICFDYICVELSMKIT